MRFIAALQLPAALPRWGRAVGVAPRDTAAGHFHLRHRGRAVWPFEARDAARQELLRPQRGHYDELVGVEMYWTDDHHGFLWTGHGEEPAGLREAQNS